jgi:hypothetical protein
MSSSFSTYHSHHMNSRGKCLDNNFVQIIVSNHSRRLKIQRHQCFVVSIVFVAIVVGEFGPMAGIMKKNSISGLALADHLLVGGNNVGLGGRSMVAIVDQYRDIFVLEAIVVLNVIVLRDNGTVRKERE